MKSIRDCLQRVLFSAHDPGGANAIIPVLERLRSSGILLCGMVTGSARQIFARKNLTFLDASVFSDEMIREKSTEFRPDVFIAGSSIGVTVDKTILLQLKGTVPAVYVLDFWINYWQRFSNRVYDFKYLPSKICVMDVSARDAMVKEGFPFDVIAVTGNPYFENFTQGISTAGQNRREILFISQPVSDMEKLSSNTPIGFTEFTTLELLISVFKQIDQSFVLNIRLHPKEDQHKYDAYLTNDILISRAFTLEAALSRAGLVIGMFSPVLIQAMMAGKQVISLEPGLLVSDPLPTNRDGLTRLASDGEQLRIFLQQYEETGVVNHSMKHGSTFHEGATQRVVSVVENVLGCYNNTYKNEK